MDLFLLGGCDSEVGLLACASSLLKGLSMLMMLVGIEGVHRDSPLACGGGLGSTSTSPIANRWRAQGQKSAGAMRDAT